MEGVDKTPLLHTICFFIPVHVIINFSILSDVLFHVFVFFDRSVSWRPRGVHRALWHVPPDFQQFHFSSLWNKSDSQLSRYCVSLRD